MDRIYLNNLVILLGLILVQVLVCNHIMLFNVALAFVFIYSLIRLPMDTNINLVLTWGFLSGLIVDIFSDSAGVNALACTILALIRRPMLYAYVPRDDRTKNIIPSLQSLGFSIFGKYLYSVSLVYCLLVFIIEYFNFGDVKEIVIMSISSSILTFILLLGFDSLIVTKREKRL